VTLRLAALGSTSRIVSELTYSAATAYISDLKHASTARACTVDKQLSPGLTRREASMSKRMQLRGDSADDAVGPQQMENTFSQMTETAND
jgi:hypothetical protein